MYVVNLCGEGIAVPFPHFLILSFAVTITFIGRLLRQRIINNFAAQEKGQPPFKSKLSREIFKETLEPAMYHNFKLRQWLDWHT
ncbi:hypothetical protein P5673_017995 [Acropora cervicornis]|uniref:Uncharacterized protein n=1 Tax=Acropora cervicornis TaxID=6130 RepID=A0AAD9QEE4_ACRCE|nr:hypothetical protein P5673_017995 [Acropora cervicornis]